MPTDIKQDAFTKMLLAVLDETYDKADGLYLDSGTHWLGTLAKLDATAASKPIVEGGSSEERRVGKECRSRWSPYH